MSDSTKTYSAAQTVYARALLELAQAKDCLAEVIDEMSQIGRLLRADAGLSSLCASQILSVEKRAQSLKAIFSGQISQITFDFLGVVNLKGRLGELEAICGAFAKAADQAMGLVEVGVYVAQAMDENGLAELAGGIGKALGKTAKLNMVVEPSLIGGLKLRIGDQLLDGSVANQLKNLKQRLVAAGCEQAKLAAAAI